MIGLIEKEVDQAASVHLFFFVEQPGHAIDEGGRLGVRTNDFQVLKEVAVAVRNHMLACTRTPVARRVDDAPAFTHLHQVAIVIHRAGMNEMHLHAQLLSDVNLMVQFGIRTSQSRWKSDHTNFVNQLAFPLSEHYGRRVLLPFDRGMHG